MIIKLTIIINTVCFVMNILEKKIRKTSYVLTYVTLILLALIAIEQEKQIKTQAEYIEAQEWTEYIEEDSRLETEYMNHVKEMRG